ncbi:hypothetical protein VP01_2566g3 [Puccinia sorghi]|uniref:Uncharacterized protein n=1 Tax=Puccinia sorghi TaxID=27349 RepID=A0A0L6V509_9BASI|nr:hypothetical protein VP01_2566g3 [Puccinia sorghi]
MDSISEAGITSWIRSQRSKTHAYNYQSCILSVFLSAYDKNSNQPSPDGLHFNFIYSQIRKLVSPQATSSKILARGVKELKSADIIHRVKRFGNELVDRASNATLGLLPQTQLPTRWSLPPKTLEVLLKIRDMLVAIDPLKSWEKATDAACGYFVDTLRLAPLMFRMPKLRKSFGESKRLACLECLGTRASARRVSAMFHLERNPEVLEKEHESTLPTRRRRHSRTSQANPHSALRPPQEHQTFQIVLPGSRKRPACTPSGRRSQKRLRSLSSSSENTSTDGELIQSRLTPLLPTSSLPTPTNLLGISASQFEPLASHQDRMMSRNADHTSPSILLYGSSPLSSPISSTGQSSDSLSSCDLSESGQEKFLPPTCNFDGNSPFQPVDVDMENQLDYHPIPDSPLPANTIPSHEEVAICASDEYTRSSYSEAAAAESHASDAAVSHKGSESQPALQSRSGVSVGEEESNEVSGMPGSQVSAVEVAEVVRVQEQEDSLQDLTQLEAFLLLLDNTIGADKPSTIISGYLDGEEPQSDAHKALLRLEEAMNRNFETIRRLEAEGKQPHLSDAELERALKAINLTNQQKAWREVYEHVGYLQKCTEILNIQLTQQSSIIQIKDSISARPQSRTEIAIGVLKQTTPSWVSLFKEQVDRVQALGEMAGKELVVYGTRFFDSNQDSIQLSADRPTGNETLILPEIDISDQWEHIRQQILMLQTSQTTSGALDEQAAVRSSFFLLSWRQSDDSQPDILTQAPRSGCGEACQMDKEQLVCEVDRLKK